MTVAAAETVSKKNKKLPHGSKKSLSKEERRVKYTRLARERKARKITRKKEFNTVCFHCRQRGHTVSNCPKNTNADHRQGSTLPFVKTKICYKCGSTEHSLSQCPKKRASDDTVLPFATCFVCHQMGHLASQCPENVKGVYVNGGCCKVCGSTRHLATRCPRKQQNVEPDVNHNGKMENEEIFNELLEGEGDDSHIDASRTHLSYEASVSGARSDDATIKSKNKKPRVVNF